MQEPVEQDEIFCLDFIYNGTPFYIPIKKQFIHIKTENTITLLDGFEKQIGELTVNKVETIKDGQGQIQRHIIANNNQDFQKFLDLINKNGEQKEWLEKMLSFRPWKIKVKNDNATPSGQPFDNKKYEEIQNNKQNEKQEIELERTSPEIVISNSFINNKLIADGPDRYKQQLDDANENLQQILALFHEQLSKVDGATLQIINNDEINDNNKKENKSNNLSFKIYNNLQIISNNQKEQFDKTIEKNQQQMLTKVFSNENLVEKTLLFNNSVKHYKTTMNKIKMTNSFGELDTDIIVNLINNNDDIKTDIIDEIYDKLKNGFDQQYHNTFPTQEEFVKYITSKNSVSAKKENNNNISFDFGIDYGNNLKFDNIFYNYSIAEEPGQQKKLKSLLRNTNCDPFLRNNTKEFQQNYLMKTFSITQEHIAREIKKITGKDLDWKIAEMIICEKDNNPDNGIYSDNLKSLYYILLSLNGIKNNLNQQQISNITTSLQNGNTDLFFDTLLDIADGSKQIYPKLSKRIVDLNTKIRKIQIDKAIVKPKIQMDTSKFKYLGKDKNINTITNDIDNYTGIIEGITSEYCQENNINDDNVKKQVRSYVANKIDGLKKQFLGKNNIQKYKNNKNGEQFYKFTGDIMYDPKTHNFLLNKENTTDGNILKYFYVNDKNKKQYYDYLSKQNYFQNLKNNPLTNKSPVEIVCNIKYEDIIKGLDIKQDEPSEEPIEDDTSEHSSEKPVKPKPNPVNPVDKDSDKKPEPKPQPNPVEKDGYKPEPKPQPNPQPKPQPNPQPKKPVEKNGYKINGDIVEIVFNGKKYTLEPTIFENYFTIFDNKTKKPMQIKNKKYNAVSADDAVDFFVKQNEENNKENMKEYISLQIEKQIIKPQKQAPKPFYTGGKLMKQTNKLGQCTFNVNENNLQKWLEPLKTMSHQPVKNAFILKDSSGKIITNSPFDRTARNIISFLGSKVFNKKFVVNSDMPDDILASSDDIQTGVTLSLPVNTITNNKDNQPKPNPVNPNQVDKDDNNKPKPNPVNPKPNPKKKDDDNNKPEPEPNIDKSNNTSQSNTSSKDISSIKTEDEKINEWSKGYINTVQNILDIYNRVNKAQIGEYPDTDFIRDISIILSKIKEGKQNIQDDIDDIKDKKKDTPSEEIKNKILKGYNYILVGLNKMFGFPENYTLNKITTYGNNKIVGKNNSDKEIKKDIPVFKKKCDELISILNKVAPTEEMHRDIGTTGEHPLLQRTKKFVKIYNGYEKIFNKLSDNAHQVFINNTKGKKFKYLNLNKKNVVTAFSNQAGGNNNSFSKAREMIEKLNRDYGYLLIDKKLNFDKIIKNIVYKNILIANLEQSKITNKKPIITNIQDKYDAMFTTNKMTLDFLNKEELIMKSLLYIANDNKQRIASSKLNEEIAKLCKNDLENILPFVLNCTNETVSDIKKQINAYLLKVLIPYAKISMSQKFIMNNNDVLIDENIGKNIIGILNLGETKRLNIAKLNTRNIEDEDGIANINYDVQNSETNPAFKSKMTKQKKAFEQANKDAYFDLIDKLKLHITKNKNTIDLEKIKNDIEKKKNGIN